MPLSEVILVIMGLLTVAMLAAGFCRNIPIPFTVFLVVLGRKGMCLPRQQRDVVALDQERATGDILRLVGTEPHHQR